MNKEIKRLNDLDKFPFGEHKGKLMWHVPAEYLSQIRNDVKLMAKYPRVSAYIEWAWRVIRMELKCKHTRQ